MILFKKLLCIFLVLLCVGTLKASTLRIRRSSSTNNTESSKDTTDSTKATTESIQSTTEKKDICEGRTPCGWAVYNRSTRNIEYFMRNKCECGETKRCLKSEDDISLTAYVYRCSTDKDNEKRH